MVDQAKSYAKFNKKIKESEDCNIWSMQILKCTYEYGRGLSWILSTWTYILILSCIFLFMKVILFDSAKECNFEILWDVFNM